MAEQAATPTVLHIIFKAPAEPAERCMMVEPGKPLIWCLLENFSRNVF